MVSYLCSIATTCMTMEEGLRQTKNNVRGLATELKTKEGNISYEELKIFAQDRSRWSQ